MTGEVFLTILTVALLAGGAVLLGRWLLRREIVWDWERGLLYSDGAYVRTLEPGHHWILPLRDTVFRIDTRRQTRVLSGQEILTNDLIAIKISLSIGFAISDPKRWIGTVAGAEQEMIEAARLLLRDVVLGLTLDGVLEGREAIPARIKDGLAPVAEDLGFTVESVAIRDVMLPANLKRAYSGVLEAKKDAERRLELARGEQAVVRSLANTARVLDGNPTLLKVRMLQAAERGGNTIHFEIGPDAGGSGEAQAETNG